MNEMTEANGTADDRIARDLAEAHAVPPPFDGYRNIDPTDVFENRAGPFFARFEESGRPIFAFSADRRHCNSNGVMHGGCMMTFMDLVVCSTARHLEHDGGVVTVSFTADFMASVLAGDMVEAEAWVTRATGSLIFLQGKARVGDRQVFACQAVTKRIKR